MVVRANKIQHLIGRYLLFMYFFVDKQSFNWFSDDGSHVNIIDLWKVIEL